MVGDREGFDPSSGSINESFVSPLAKQRAAVVESKPDFGSPKELELSNSLSNLKWGFRKREEKLLEELATHKEALYALYGTHQKLKTYLNETGAAVVNNLESMEAYNEGQDEHAEEHATHLQALLVKVQELERSKAELEDSKTELQQRLDAVLCAQYNATGTFSEKEATPRSGDKAIPRSLISDAVLAAYQAAGTRDSVQEDQQPPQMQSPLESPKSVSSSPRRHSSQTESSPLKERRKSTGSTEEPTKKTKDSSTNERNSRKPAVPKQDEIRKSLRQLSSPDKQYSSDNNNSRSSRNVITVLPTTPRRHRVSTTGAVRTSDVRSADKYPRSSPTDRNKEREKGPRVSLRKRIEEHQAQKEKQAFLLRDRDNNPWLCTYSTSTRASQGGCEFFVDLVAGQEDSPTKGAYSPRNGSSRSSPRKSAVDLGGASEHVGKVPEENTEENKVELLRMESVDLQDLQNASQEAIDLSPLARSTAFGGSAVDSAVEEALDTDSLDGDRANPHLLDLCDTRTGENETPTVHANSSLSVQEVNYSALANPSVSLLGAGSTPGSPVSRSNQQIILDTIKYKRQVSALQAQLDEVRGQSQSNRSPLRIETPGGERVNEPRVAAMTSNESPQSAYLPEQHFQQTFNVEDGAFDAMFVELIDAAVQCDEWPLSSHTAPNLAAAAVAEPGDTSVATNTDVVDVSTRGTSTSSLPDEAQPPLSIGSPGSPSRRYSAFSGPSTEKTVPPEVKCTPEDALLMKNIENSKFLLGKKLFEMKYGAKSKPVSAPPETVHQQKSSGVLKPPPSKPATLSAADIAVQRAILSETLQMNRTLVNRLKHEQAVAGRTQRKIQLLEEKLCRLIIFIKASAKAGTGFAGLREPRPVTAGVEAEAEVAEVQGVEEEVEEEVEEVAWGEAKAAAEEKIQESSNPEPTAERRQISSPPFQHEQGMRFVDSRSDGADIPDTPLQHIHPLQTATTTGQKYRQQHHQQQEQQLGVGNMSFVAGLEELLCFSDDDASDEEKSPARSLFSPAKDFQGRNYDDLEESKVSNISNPLLHSTALRKKTHPAGDEDREQSRLDISFNQDQDTSFFDMPQMESLGDQHAEMAMFSPIQTRSSTKFEPRSNKEPLFGKAGSVSVLSKPKHSAQRIANGSNSASAASSTQSTSSGAGAPVHDDRGVNAAGAAIKSLHTCRQELAQARQDAQKLTQQVDQLNLRNKNLAREKELLLTKLKHHIDGDTASFGMKIYTSEAEIALDHPTKTMSIIMGFIANNNTLLEEIVTLKGALDDKARQIDAQSQVTVQLSSELHSAQQQNYFLTSELEDANSLMSTSQGERESLHSQVSQLTANVIHLAQENKLLKEKMRLYQY